MGSIVKPGESAGDELPPPLPPPVARSTRSDPPPLPPRSSDPGWLDAFRFIGPRGAVPFVARLLPAYRRRQRFAQAARETPCWLTSLTVHLTFVVVLGMLIVPSQRRKWSRSLLLTTSMVEGEREQNEGDVLYTQVDRQDLKALAENVFEAATQLIGKPTMTNEQVESSPVDETVGEPDFFVTTTSSQTLDDPIRPVDPPPEDGGDLMGTLMQHRNRDHEKIVQRFIQYDIGRLPGQAGRTAYQKFKMLGPEAIPALVRGLNRSASIQASCPVGVISHTLLDRLAQSNDATAMDYALSNIAADVPPGAPHHNRIVRFRDTLRSAVAAKRKSMKEFFDQKRKQRENLRRQMVDQGYEASDEVLDRTTRLLAQSSDVTDAALKHQDRRWREAAAVATMLRWKQMPEALRVSRAQAMIDRLGDDDPKVRSVANLTLTKLASTLGGPVPGASHGNDTAQRREAWQKWYTVVVRDTVVGRRAENDLRLATQLERLGRHDKALARYQQITARYPGTPAAQRASQRAGAIGSP